jgi:chorismate-pyruvate lyase
MMRHALAPDQRRTALHDAVFPLNAFYSRAGVPLPRVELIAPDAMPELPRRLLVHSQDMTPTLQAHHCDEIHIEVLGRERRQESYFREVILRLDGNDRPVEFGASKIDLDALPPLVRRLVLQEQLPIGHLLKAHEVPHSGRPTAFFRVEADHIMRRSLGLASGATLYGRRNTLRDSNGRVLCEVVEILPP